MSSLLCLTLNTLTHESPQTHEKDSLDEFFIDKIFPSVAAIYPLKNSALLLMDKEDRILSIVSHDSDFEEYSFSNRMFSFSESESESESKMHKFMLRYDKTNLYLLKNIPYMLHYPGYSLLLISENEIPEAFPDLHRIYESLENLAISNGKQYKSYKELLKYLDAVDDGISACDKDGNVT